MSKKFILLSLILLSFVAWALAGTTGKIAGRVTDAQSGEPLAGANVIIEGTTMGAAADANGDYYILNVRPGTYTVVASMVGYAQVSQTDVMVSADRTIPIDFDLASATLEGETITVVAERDVVEHDISSSQFTATIDMITETPLVVDVQEYINLQAGIRALVDEDGNEQILVRGGALDQVGLVVDGLTMTNNESNEPMNIVNLSAIEEISIIKGGFNAEYANIRSGLINVVTKEGAAQRYTGSLDFRYGVAHQKHRGAGVYDINNYFLRPFLDPQVAFVGTKNGPWSDYAKEQYPEFDGWNAFTAANPELGLTPQDAYNLYAWETSAEPSKALGHPHPGEYGKEPDLNTDISFGGPIPVVGSILGDLSFFASFRDAREAYPLPHIRPFIETTNTYFKLTSRVSDNVKLGVEVMYGEEQNSGSQASNLGGGVGRGLYFISGASPADIYRGMVGITFDHVLSPSTFYTLRINRVNQENDVYGARIVRDKTILKTFGNVQIDERPYGWDPVQGYQYAHGTRFVIGGVGGGQRDFTKIATWNAKFDFTSQIDKFNQLKAGLEFVSDDYDVWRGERGLDPTGNYTVDWEQTPIRWGAYVQDKIEFQGMIANLGLRVDMNDPNVDWYTVDRYSQFFSRPFKNRFLTDTPTEPAEGNLHIAPRLGISHPITENSKLYFNYGHFYSMPQSWSMYEIDFGISNSGIDNLGNPNLKMPRTIAYELGYEHEIGDMFLVGIAGYYKDVSDQIARLNYVSYDESVNYTTYTNQEYADIRGFELSLEKRWGDWVTGWFNYNYMVVTDGQIGRRFQYQDPRRQAVESLRNPYQEKPLPQPWARGSIQFRTPRDWGPKVAGIALFDQLSVNLLGSWDSGQWFTWDPIQPFTEYNNVQWVDQWMFDMRIMKHLAFGRYQFDLFVDIRNVFDLEYLRGPEYGFDGGTGGRPNDFRDYMNSLHLDIYKDSKYANDPLYQSGDDRPGTEWSRDKLYVNMPNVDFLAWSPPRSVVLGLKFHF